MPTAAKPEIERKFLLPQGLSVRALLVAAGVNFTEAHIVQNYLAAAPGEEARIRRRDTTNGTVYFHTVKTPTADPMVRGEAEREITAAEYTDLLSTRIPNLLQISKTRITFDWLEQTFEVDIFDSHPPLILMEIELSDVTRSIQMPPFITPVREVTKDPAFKNANLAKQIPANAS